MCDFLEGKIGGEKGVSKMCTLLLSSFKLPDPENRIAKGQMCAVQVMLSCDAFHFVSAVLGGDQR